MVCTIHRAARAHTPATNPCHTGLDPVSICLHAHMDPGSSPGMTKKRTEPTHPPLSPVIPDLIGYPSAFMYTWIPGLRPGRQTKAHRAHTPATKPCHTGLDPVSIGCHANMDPGSSPGMTNKSAQSPHTRHQALSYRTRSGIHRLSCKHGSRVFARDDSLRS